MLEWGAYYHLEPFGQDRENLHAAQIAAAVCQVMGVKKSPKDFMYKDAESAAEEQVSAFFERMDRLKKDGSVG